MTRVLLKSTSVARYASLLVAVLTLLSPTFANAGPVEEANAAVDRWSAAYNSNSPEVVVKTYWDDAILLGTVSPVISIGTTGIEEYFARLRGSGNKNVIQERHVIRLGDTAAVVTGFYKFTVVKQGKGAERPARFTMVVTKRGGEWRIAHHHSSPHVEPK